MDQKTGIAATLSIIAAVGSYIATCAGHPAWGLFAALLSLPLGLVGVVMSASPRVKGGMLSIVAIIFGLAGVTVAILGITGTIIF